ncbi:MAG TPA: DUF883 domain-containing protein [Burkholderiales bacterium]|nr:DUF883 domain-containing protein [Burkholderiales bacterium]
MNTPGEKLATDIKVLLHSVEDLVKITAAETSGKVIELRRRMQQAIDDVKPQIASIETAVIAKTKPAALAADEYVRANPWTAIGAAALVGLALGLLVSRR